MLSDRDTADQVEFGGGKLQDWIEEGWLRPSAHQFSQADLARARFIKDLRQEMGINDDAVAVILDLVDQVHGLRKLLDEVVSAVCVQPPTIQRRIALDARRMALLTNTHSCKHAGRPSPDILKRRRGAKEAH